MKLFKILLSPITALKHLWYRWAVLTVLVLVQGVYTTLVVLDKVSFSKSLNISVFWLVTSWIVLLILNVGLSISFTLATRKNIVMDK